MGFNDYIIKDYGVRTNKEEEEREIDISCYDPREAKKAKRKERSFDYDTWVPRIFWGLMCGTAVFQFVRSIIALRKETKS